MTDLPGPYVIYEGSEREGGNKELHTHRHKHTSFPLVSRLFGHRHGHDGPVSIGAPCSATLEPE